MAITTVLVETPLPKGNQNPVIQAMLDNEVAQFNQTISNKPSIKSIAIIGFAILAIMVIVKKVS